MADEEGRNISSYETYVSSPNERTVLLVRGRQETWQEQLGLDEPRTLNFWRCVLAEFTTSLLFIIVTCGAVFNNSTLHQALCTGFVVAILVSVGNEKSGYFNPAISFGLLVGRRIKLVRFFFYAAVQIGGGLAGAGLLYLYTPRNIRGGLGALALHPDISSGIAFVVELTISFIVVWTVVATTDPDKRFNGFQSPLAVGLSVSIGMLMAIPYTGAALNPIRAFGPAIIMNKLADHWVYWIGPLVGALLASLAYEFVFKLGKEEEEPRANKHEMPTVQLHINTNSSNM